MLSLFNRQNFIGISLTFAMLKEKVSYKSKTLKKKWEISLKFEDGTFSHYFLQQQQQQKLKNSMELHTHTCQNLLILVSLELFLFRKFGNRTRDFNFKK